MTLFRFLPILTVSGACLGLLNCSTPKHDVKEKFYLVATNVKLPYWQTVKDGFLHAAGQMGVQAEMVGPDTYDVKEEASEMQRITKLKPTGILISAGDAQLLKPYIDAAVSSGIPVIAADSDVPDSKRLMFVGTNNYDAGRAGGQLAVKLLKGKGNLVVFTMVGQHNTEERLHGYRDVFADHPGIKLIEVVDDKGDPRITFDKTMELLTKNKEKIDGFLCLEATAGKEVADVLDRNHATGKMVIAFDTDDETVDWVQKGGIQATIAQKPYTMGYFGLQMLDEVHHSGLAMDHDWGNDPFALIPRFIDTGSTMIDKSNVDVFLKSRASSKTEK